MAMSIQDFKRIALERAQAAPPNPSLPAADPQSLQALQSLPTQGPQVTPQNQPGVTNPQTDAKPGPIKGFLQSFLYGAGQGLLAHNGLETDAQKQQRMFNQNLQLQNAQALNDLRAQQAQASALQNQPVDLSTYGIPGLSGTVVQKDAANIIRQHVANQGKLATADRAADSREAVQELRNEPYSERTRMMYGGAGSEGGPLTHGFKDIGGRAVMYDRRTGQVIRDMGPSNALSTANARAEAQARYGLVPTLDENGNPTVTSRLNALQNGNPNVTFEQGKGVLSDKVGINQYEDILRNKIQANLGVLDDNKQRGIIAHTLSEAEKNPGAIQSIITSSMQDGLSPEGAKLAAGILQGREFGGVARKYGGNMNGTEGLMNRIMSNQPGPLNSRQLNEELINNDLAFTQKANSALAGLTSNRKGGKSSANQTSGSSDNSIPTYERGADGKLHLVKK